MHRKFIFPYPATRIENKFLSSFYACRKFLKPGCCIVWILNIFSFLWMLKNLPWPAQSRPILVVDTTHGFRYCRRHNCVLWWCTRLIVMCVMPRTEADSVLMADVRTQPWLSLTLTFWLPNPADVPCLLSKSLIFYFVFVWARGVTFISHCIIWYLLPLFTNDSTVGPSILSLTALSCILYDDCHDPICTFGLLE